MGGANSETPAGGVVVMDAVAVPTARSAMVLYRRVYLTGALVAVLTLVVGVVALVALVGLKRQASTLVVRDNARALLGAAQFDVTEGQSQVTLALSDLSSAANLAV